MATAIKCFIGILMVIFGTFLQLKSNGNNLFDFLYGEEAVIAGMIILATA